MQQQRCLLCPKFSSPVIASRLIVILHMHIVSVQVSLILVLFAALVCHCNASIVLTATLASGKARLNPEVHDKHSVSQRALDIFSIVPMQSANVGDCVVLQLDLNRSVQGVILATTSFGLNKVVFSGSIPDGKNGTDHVQI